jgi:hypothetical protein
MTNRTKYLASALLLALAGSACAQEASPAPAPTPPGGECSYEDILAFELKEDAYDLPAGYTICLHIDQVRDTPTPANPTGEVPISGIDNPIDCGEGFHLEDDICLMD